MSEVSIRAFGIRPRRTKAESLRAGVQGCCQACAMRQAHPWWQARLQPCLDAFSQRAIVASIGGVPGALVHLFLRPDWVTAQSRVASPKPDYGEVVS